MDLSEMGPIDYVLIEWPDRQPDGSAVPHLVDLVDRGIIRLLDLTFITKGEDGSVAAMEIADLGEGAEEFAVFEGASSGLLTDEDTDEAAGALEPGTSAALLVFENRWAAPFATAVANPAASWSPADASRSRPCWPRSRRPRPPPEQKGATNARTAPRSCPHRRVAGTATAVSNRVSRRQASRWAEQEPQQYAAEPQYAEPAPAPAPAAAPAQSLPEQLKELAALRDQGVLTEEEFAAQKAKILAA